MSFTWLTKEEAEKLNVGEIIHPNGRYEDLKTPEGEEYAYVIRKEDTLYIREKRENGFVVELREDVVRKKEKEDSLYGLFFIDFRKISKIEND